ncbi:hypothetical protein PIB30_032710 [Stylosanthes scabra]|uniref:Transposase (putative) gypsy type domain-containing protein n=1 Tax=Stylosanthes scabra TaxID=79078 RepID=A0ABU6RCQ5_9FABA|nr:hypothetical protein [Stylosanthes scabra]
MDPIRVPCWAKSRIGVHIWLLGRADPMSRTVAPNLWSFGGSELRKLICPELRKWLRRSFGGSETLSFKVAGPSVNLQVGFSDVLGAPSTLNQAYLDELKAAEIIFGGGDLERRYKVEAAHRGERVCFLNLQHPTVPHWLWVNEVMFTEFGVRVPFTDFQQRLLNRSCIAPSQLYPNAWATIRYFELVTEWLELPQEPEVFMTLFTFYSLNTSEKTKKGYMSVRPAKGRKIFGLFEDSFHDFKGRYFKILPVGTHWPFWLSLEGDGRFPSYWTDKAGFDVAPVTYKGLRAEQKDTVDVLTILFHKNNLAPKALLGRPEEAQRDVVRMVGNDVTLARLRSLIRLPATGGVVGATTSTFVPTRSAPSSTARATTPPVGPTPGTQDTPEEGSSNGGGMNNEGTLDISSPDRNLEQNQPQSSPKKRSLPEGSTAAKRQKTKGSSRDFSALDRSFDASGFVATHLLVPKAQEVLRDYDPVESIQWAEWAMLRSATIMKSIEPSLSKLAEAEWQNSKLVGDLKSLNLQKVALEERVVDSAKAKEKVEGDLKLFEKSLEVFKQKKDEEVATLQGRIRELESKVAKLNDSVVAEKARADRSEERIPDLEKQRDDNVEDAKAAMAATEGVLKTQLAVLFPDFDVSQIGFFKEIVDGKVVDLPMDPPSS